MKTSSYSLSLSDVAHAVSEIIENHSPRYVAVVVRENSPAAPAYGFSNRGTFQAIIEAIGERAANDLVADSRQGDSYSFDENFGRDVSRLTDSAGELLAILVRS